MPNSMNTMQGCCCDEECDCETGGPTVDFSYEQTDDDPCTIDLFDESTDGTCGEIVSWSWRLNDVEFSTSQNPTGVEVEDGDEITLVVVDSSGCTDEAVMVIACETLYDCEVCADEPLPGTVELTADWLAEPLPASGCDDCTWINGPHTLDWSGGCTWTKEITPVDCEAYYDPPIIPDKPYWTVAIINNAGSIEVVATFTVFGGGTVTYKKVLGADPQDCRGTHVLTAVDYDGATVPCLTGDGFEPYTNQLTVVI